jgi:hypothetical protein
MQKEIVIRSGTGAVKGRAVLVAYRAGGLHPTHNGDGFYQHSVGVDADGNAYETKPRGGGWRRAQGVRASSIRHMFRVAV